MKRFKITEIGLETWDEMKHDKIYNRPHNEVLVKSEDR